MHKSQAYQTYLWQCACLQESSERQNAGLAEQHALYRAHSAQAGRQHAHGTTVSTGEQQRTALALNSGQRTQQHLKPASAQPGCACGSRPPAGGVSAWHTQQACPPGRASWG